MEKKLNQDKKTEDMKLDVPNDINVIIKSKKDGILFDQDCCTCINFILNSDGEIATSFLGIHNEFLISQLGRAMKTYFKSLKKALKEERKKAKESLDELNDNDKKEEESKEKSNKIDDSVNKENSTSKIKSVPHDEVKVHKDKANPTKDKPQVISTEKDTFSHKVQDNGNPLYKKRETKNNKTK